MQATLQMSSAYHTPVGYWLELPMVELMQWAMTGKEMNEEKRNG